MALPTVVDRLIEAYELAKKDGNYLAMAEIAIEIKMCEKGND